MSNVKFRQGDLIIQCEVVSWDSTLFGRNVAQINLSAAEFESEKHDFLNLSLSEWFDQEQIELASCRVDSTDISAIRWLEEHQFRFIETVLRPYLEFPFNHSQNDQVLGITLSEAKESDLLSLSKIAATSFRHERYHADPLVDNSIANQRYSNWVTSSFKNPKHSILVAREMDKVVGFFVIEYLQPKHAYWHLTGMATNSQGRGLGYKTWLKVLELHHSRGDVKVATTISSSNVRVLNLYSKLGFKFIDPMTTFHWHKQ